MQSKFASANWLVTIFVLIMFSLFAANANAECCKRKGTFGCCGNGKCNAFCCKCKGGCNKPCEKTSCNDTQWAACAGICTGCTAACATGVGAAVCVACMGVSYESCKHCIAADSSRSVKAMPGNDAEDRAARDDFFKYIAKHDGDDRTISFSDFSAFMQHEMNRTGINKTTAPLDVMFKAYDINNDGVIDRHEFDNENVMHGLSHD